MEFLKFKQLMSKVVNYELPGEEIHWQMAPIERLLELKIQAASSSSTRKAGVMVLFYPDTNKMTRLVLILRKTYKGVHSGQVGFPGGKMEADDDDLQHTALRETEEEIGVVKNHISVSKALTQLYIPPSNFMVFPFLGTVDFTPQFVLQPSEVEDIIEIDFPVLMHDNALITQSLSTSYASSIVVPAFKFNEHIVWGATAMILNEVRHLFKQVI